MPDGPFRGISFSVNSLYTNYLHQSVYSFVIHFIACLSQDKLHLYIPIEGSPQILPIQQAHE